MAITNTKTDSAPETIESLRAELGRLNERIAALEAATGPETAAQPKASPPAALDEVLNDELLSVIAAAVAAYLGVKPHIRQIHLITNISWAQQGRVTIQASHAYTPHIR